MTIWKNTCGGSWQGTIENGGEVSGKPGAFLFFIPKGALTHHLLKQAVVWPSATVRSPRGHGVCGRRWTMSQPGRCCCHRPCSQPCDGMAKCHLTQLPPACANLPPAALSQIHGRNKSFHPCLVGCRDSRRPF